MLEMTEYQESDGDVGDGNAHEKKQDNPKRPEIFLPCKRPLLARDQVNKWNHLVLLSSAIAISEAIFSIDPIP